jgi:hypothetical protein
MPATRTTSDKLMEMSAIETRAPIWMIFAAVFIGAALAIPVSGEQISIDGALVLAGKVHYPSQQFMAQFHFFGGLSSIRFAPFSVVWSETVHRSGRTGTNRNCVVNGWICDVDLWSNAQRDRFTYRRAILYLYWDLNPLFSVD